MEIIKEYIIKAEQKYPKTLINRAKGSRVGGKKM